MEQKFSDTTLLQFVKTLAVRRGLSLRKLLFVLNKEKSMSNCYSGFYNKLKNDTLKFRELVEIAEILGYEIIFKESPKN